MKCPKCGSKMVLRTARRGYNIGNQFYGCSNYPQCNATIKYEKKSEFSFGIFLSYIVVSIITFIAMIIIIDTFKNPLYDKIPQLEFILTSLFETLKDLILDKT